jgi:hypothetical protein
MSLLNQVIPVSGEKIESLLIGDNALQLLSSEQNSVEEFNAAWTKTLTLATKTDIAFDGIKSITKEDGEDHIVVNYKGGMGLPKECKITFTNPTDLGEFFTFFQESKGFTRTDEALSPFKSTLPYLFGLAVTLGVTAFGYYLADGAEHGEPEPEGNTRGARKGRFYRMIAETLGTKGVLLLGLAISAYVVYMIVQHYKKPPVQTKLVP